MKIDFNPQESHFLILRALHESNGQLSFSDLQKVVKIISNKKQEIIDFQYFVRVLSGKYFHDEDKHGEEIETQLERDIDGLIFLGLLKTDTDPNIKQFYRLDTTKFYYGLIIVLTEEGERIAKGYVENRRIILRPRKELRTTVFIACAFGYKEIDDLCNKQFMPVCEALGYEAIRVDITEPHQTITEKIMEGITEAACVIADLTYARPSVYFEVGYAVGLGIPLMITCRQDHFRGIKDDQRVHFDLAQYKISFWTRKDGKVNWRGKVMAPGKRLALILRSRK
jgi:hypothetical protein